MAETKKKQQREFTLALPVGTILRNGQYQYRIGEVLGQGNYGITYKASAMVKIGNISKPMTFAIKENFAKQYCSRKADGVTMSYSSVHAEEAKRDLKDFVAEGKTLAQICNGHKNIVNVNETFEENNTAYYVMEFIEGGNLCDLVKSKVRLTENEAIQIFVPIVDAVSHIHKNRRLHLDIKPENIMLKKDGTPILIDFGITLHFNANGGLTGTSKDRSGGLSEGYAPMEQYSGVTTFAPEIDVYALGATLYYMLVGKDPAKASDISTKKIEAALPLDISEITRSALLHAMRKLAEDRTPSADEFLIELRKLRVKPERVKSKKWSELSFIDKWKLARSHRNTFAQSMMSLCILAGFLLAGCGVTYFVNPFGFVYISLWLESYIDLLWILPVFLLLILATGNKWGFWALLLNVILLLMPLILNLSDNLRLFVGIPMLVVLGILWLSFQNPKKNKEVSYWNWMDLK